MSKEVILNKLRTALKVNPLTHEKGKYENILQPVESDPVKEYVRGQIANRSEVIECSKEEVVSKINEILKQENVDKVLTQTSLSEMDIACEKVLYNKPMEEMKDTLFTIDAAVLEADYGISNLGIIALKSSVDKPRLLSLITRCNIILLKKENIKGTLADALNDVKAKHPDKLPTNILFIAGPSRTADIEFQVVFGVHGPQKVYIILY